MTPFIKLWVKCIHVSGKSAESNHAFTDCVRTIHRSQDSSRNFTAVKAQNQYITSRLQLMWCGEVLWNIPPTYYLPQAEYLYHALFQDMYTIIFLLLLCLFTVNQLIFYTLNIIISYQVEKSGSTLFRYWISFWYFLNGNIICTLNCFMVWTWWNRSQHSCDQMPRWIYVSGRTYMLLYCH